MTVPYRVNQLFTQSKVLNNTIIIPFFWAIEMEFKFSISYCTDMLIHIKLYQMLLIQMNKCKIQRFQSIIIICMALTLFCESISQYIVLEWFSLNSHLMMVLKVFITILYNIFMYREFVYLNIGMYFIPDLISIKFN